MVKTLRIWETPGREVIFKKILKKILLKTPVYDFYLSKIFNNT